MADRCNPTGFAGSCKETGYDAQNEQKTNAVNQLIRPDQTITKEGMGKADTRPGPER